MRAAFLVHLSSAEPRQSQTDRGNCLTIMNTDDVDDADDPDDPDDEEDDDEDDEDDAPGKRDDDDQDDWDDDEDSEEDEDDEEPETWQVVDFPAANCLDWRDFPAQPGWRRFSRSRVATAVLPRRRP
jgi:hypothetical protein